MFLIDARSARVTWTILVFAAALWLVYLLRTPILLFVFSLFFAYLIFPIVRVVQGRLRGRGGRALAIGVVYLLLLLALVGLGLGVGPRLTEEVRLLTQKAPEMSRQLASGQIVTDMLQKRGWESARVRQVEGAVRAHAGQIIGYVQGALAGVVRWLAGAWVVVLVPVFAFFILKDAESAAAGIDGLIAKPRHRELWRDIAEDVHLLLAKYVRALILLSMITFVVWSAAFFLADVPYPVGLAAIGGALELLPVVGPLTAGVIVVGVALFSGYAHPWLLVAFVLVWRGIQDYVSSPLVMGRGIEIPPAVVIFGVIAGGEIGGPAGMFLSVPVIAALRIVWRRVRDSRSGAARHGRTLPELVLGTEWIVDAHGCDPSSLRSRAALGGLFARIVEELGLHPAGEPVWHVFPGQGGITGVLLLSESHLACHTFPERGFAAFDLYCCRPPREWPWAARLADALGAAEVRVRSVPRGESGGIVGEGGRS